MRIFRSLLPILILLQTAAAAEPNILHPIQTFPALVEPGGEFEIRLDRPADAPEPALILFGEEYPLQVLDARPGAHTVPVRVPDRLPPELYDLRLGPGSAPVRNAVRVIRSFGTDYYFIHVTDTHFRRAGHEKNAYARKLAEEINLINPEFVILTGDIISTGEDICRALMRSQGSLAHYLGGPAREEMHDIVHGEISAFFEFADRLRVPLFAVPGNHDMAGELNPVCREIWESRFTHRHLSFSYGDDYYAGLDNSQMFETAPMVYPDADPDSIRDFDAEQLEWIDAELGANTDARLKTLFFHCPLRGVESRLKSIMSSRGVDLALTGHLHVDMAWRESEPGPLWLMTRDAPLGYRLIRVGGRGLVSWGRPESTPEYRARVQQMAQLFAGGSGNAEDPYALDLDKLLIEFSGPNDGSLDRIGARIENRNHEEFENALVRLVMARGEYSVSGGTTVQSIHLGSRTLLHVAAVIPARDTVEILAARDR